MPLPIILAGAALVAGAFGVKKGVDAKSDYDSAERINRSARRLFDDAQDELETARELANSSIEDLGKLKYSIFEDSMIPFVQEFNKIKNIDYKKDSIDGLEAFKANDRESFKEIENTVLAMKDVVDGGITSISAGGLAGLAAYGGVGLLGSASTGTAIGSLSGAAATNATLAWLGGGSLATGGLGVAGGTAVLGGIVAGPVLAIGGMMLASKAEEAKENAYANQDRAILHAEEMNLATVATKGIQARFDELSSVLYRLNSIFISYLEGIKKINFEEPLRLEKIKREMASEIVVEIEGLLVCIENYELSKIGFLNKIKYLFSENKDFIKFQSQSKVLANELANETFGALFDIDLIDLSSAKPSDLKQFCIQLKSSIEKQLDISIGKVDFGLLSIEDQKGLHMAFNLAVTIDNLLEAQVLSDSGELTEKSLEAIESSKECLEGFEENEFKVAV